MKNTQRPFTLDRIVRILISLAIIVALFLFIGSVSGVLVPFFIAWLLAYLINPLIITTQRRLKIKNKTITILAVLLVILSIIIGAFWILIPSITKEFASLHVAASSYFEGKKFIDFIPIEVQEYIVKNYNINKIISSLSFENLSSISGGIFSLFGGIFKGSFALIMSIITIFVTLLYLVFILIDFEQVTEGAIDLIPPKYREQSVIIIEDVKVAMDRYFRGQFLVALSVGILLSIGFKIINLPLAIPLGLFIGALNMVPYLQIVGILPMILISLLKCVESDGNFWVIFAFAFGVLMVVQIIQDTVLVPKIMGKVTGLNPAVILLSLSIWGALLGIIGMIIALPMTSILLSYYKRFVIKRQDS